MRRDQGGHGARRGHVLEESSGVQERIGINNIKIIRSDGAGSAGGVVRTTPIPGCSRPRRDRGARLGVMLVQGKQLKMCCSRVLSIGWTA